MAEDEAALGELFSHPATSWEVNAPPHFACSFIKSDKLSFSAHFLHVF
jgi:hypothetical protein